MSNEVPRVDVPRCPLVDGSEFDPLGTREAEDPMPWLRAAQHDAPVFYLPRYDLWCITRYADVLGVLRDTDRFSSRKTINLDKIPPDVLENFPDGPPDRVLVSLDPPDHTRLRQIAQKAFTPKLVEAREDEIRTLCHALIDDFAADRRCDIVKEFASHLPVQVITRLIGAPVERTPEFAQWAHDRISLLGGAPSLSPEDLNAITDRMIRFSAWLHEFVESRREYPREDLATALVQAITDDGSPVLSTAETVNLIGTVLSAGSGTTINFIPLFLSQLLGNPTQVALVRADPDLMPRAVEEGFRRSTSVYGVARVTTCPVTIAGVDIPEGANLYLHYAAAQRDDSVFADPDVFDIQRPNVHRHFAFGRGIHTCLGAPLARLQTRVAAQCLLERLPGLRLGADQEETWSPHLLTPGLASLELEWD